MKSGVPRLSMQPIYSMAWRIGHHILYVFVSPFEHLSSKSYNNISKYRLLQTSNSCIFNCSQVYVANGKLQLAMPMDKVKEISNLSLMVSFPYLSMES